MARTLFPRPASSKGASFLQKEVYDHQRSKL